MFDIYSACVCVWVCLKKQLSKINNHLQQHKKNKNNNIHALNSTGFVVRMAWCEILYDVQ